MSPAGFGKTGVRLRPGVRAVIADAIAVDAERPINVSDSLERFFFTLFKRIRGDAPAIRLGIAGAHVSIGGGSVDQDIEIVPGDVVAVERIVPDVDMGQDHVDAHLAIGRQGQLIDVIIAGARPDTHLELTAVDRGATEPVPRFAVDPPLVSQLGGDMKQVRPGQSKGETER